MNLIWVWPKISETNQQEQTESGILSPRIAAALMNATRVFIHGLEGSSQGTKGVFFRKRYPDMIIEDFRGTLGQRMNKLNSLLSEKTSLIMVKEQNM